MNTVINFHDVYDKVWFEKTLLLLKKRYYLVSIEDIDSFFYSKKALKNTCHLTVDDGDKTFYDVIYPLLKKHNIPASLFVSPKAIKSDENFWFQEIESFDEKQLLKTISKYYDYDPSLLRNYPAVIILKNFTIAEIWKIIELHKKDNNLTQIKRYNINVEELLEIDKSNLITIGAHTQNHPILANEGDNLSKLEIEDSIKGLEEILGREIKFFAYPNGTPNLDFGEREKNFLKQNGVRLSFTTDINNFKLTDDPLAIPRIGISFGSENMIRVKLLLGKYWNILKKIKSTDESTKRHSLKEKLNLPNVQNQS